MHKDFKVNITRSFFLYAMSLNIAVAHLPGMLVRSLWHSLINSSVWLQKA